MWTPRPWTHLHTYLFFLFLYLLLFFCIRHWLVLNSQLFVTIRCLGFYNVCPVAAVIHASLLLMKKKKITSRLNDSCVASGRTEELCALRRSMCYADFLGADLENKAGGAGSREV